MYSASKVVFKINISYRNIVYYCGVLRLERNDKSLSERSIYNTEVYIIVKDRIGIYQQME